MGLYECRGCTFATGSWAAMKDHAKSVHGQDLSDESDDGGRQRLTLDETLALLDVMEQQARQETDLTELGEYWDGWADALAALRQHVKTGVKVTCFPAGSCTCHPLKLERR